MLFRSQKTNKEIQGKVPLNSIVIKQRQLFMNHIMPNSKYSALSSTTERSSNQLYNIFNEQSKQTRIMTGSYTQFRNTKKPSKCFGILIKRPQDIERETKFSIIPSAHSTKAL